MNIVERLRLYKPIDNTSTLINEAADLIEQQAARIKELEAAMPLYDELLIRCAIAEKELAALRQRIDDAPVVGYHFSRHDNFGRIVWDVDHAVHPDAIEYRPLISKEDLQNET